MKSKKVNELAVRDGVLNYWVVARYNPIDTRTTEEKMRAEIQAQFTGRSNTIDDDLGLIGTEWYGPLEVIAETKVNWIIRTERDEEIFHKKSDYEFMILGEKV